MTAIPPRWRRRAGRALALPGLGLAALGAAVTLGSAPALAADRGVILFQPVADSSGTFTGVGAGPFSTAYPDGVADDGKTLARNKVVADNFSKAYKWGSSGSKGGMVIKNISGKKICQITIGILDDSTFPKDVTQYKAPDGWKATVSEDAKTLTFAAVKKPDNCVANGDWFWMTVPASPKPTGTVAPTLDGKLALADGGSDATALTSIEPDTVATSTATATATATDSSIPTDSATSTIADTPTDSATATDTATPTGTATGSVPPPSDSAAPNPPVASTTSPAAGAGF